jgi:uncharacterized repeat protein (TIGR01451 family)
VDGHKRWIWIRLTVAAVAVLLAAVAGASIAQGVYTLGGTAGQADAGRLVAETYTLQGGFWGGAYRDTAPRVADLAIEKDFARLGEAITYTLRVTNAGPLDVSGAIVSDTLPVEVQEAAWRCEASAGATCGGSGTGDVADSVDLGAGSAITYTLSGLLGPFDHPINTAEVIAPEGVQDPDPANNVASSASGYWVGLPLIVRNGSSFAGAR